jgi:hypothetical protein
MVIADRRTRSQDTIVEMIDQRDVIEEILSSLEMIVGDDRDTQKGIK